MGYRVPPEIIGPKKIIGVALLGEGGELITRHFFDEPEVIEEGDAITYGYELHFNDATDPDTKEARG